jgi:hypothetical protein
MESTDSSQTKTLLKTETSPASSFSESYLENCNYIIQWLYLSMNNRIKPVCYCLASDPHILQWLNIVNTEASQTKQSKNPSNHPSPKDYLENRSYCRYHPKTILGIHRHLFSGQKHPTAYHLYSH